MASLNNIQNFYKTTLAFNITTTGAGKIYVAELPTPTEGYLVISGASTSKREIIFYNAKGTDATGNYVTVPDVGSRGMGGTTAQTHDAQESVRMNVTAQHWADLIATIAAIVAVGSPDASAVVKGVTRLSVAPASPSAPIAVGINDPKVPTADPTTLFAPISVTSTPPGAVVPYAGASAPSGWLLCDGAAVSRATYAALFAIVSTTFGVGDGSTTFNVPNMKTRFPLGLNTAKKNVLEDCEDAWNESVGANVTSSLESSDFKVGSGSVKLTVGAAAVAGVILATEAISSTNLKPYKTISLWVKSTIATASGDLQLLLDDTPSCASPLDNLDLPALVANTWTRVNLTLNFPGNLGGIISIGMKMVNDIGAFDLYIDDVAFGNGFEIGTTGGEETHTPVVAEMASHTHNMINSAGTGIYPAGFAQDGNGSGTETNTPIVGAGGGEAHNTVPPFLTLNYIIKT